MQAYELRSNAGLDDLVLTDLPEPNFGPDQVLIEMRAASLNYRDLMVLNGLYPESPPPLIPVSDGVGIVVAIGENVTRVKPGDRVAGVFDQNWICGNITEQRKSLGGQVNGVLAQRIVLHQDGVVHVPEYLTDEEAATLPCAAVTAWNALMVQNHLTPGMKVLVQGTGGVSLFAMQLARMAGADVIAISGSEHKLEQARRLGAEATINYQSAPDWDQAVLNLTDGKGVDIVVDVGGADSLPRAIKCVRHGGHVSLIGLASGVNADIFIPVLLFKQIRMQGVYVGNRDMFEAMNTALAAHKIKPVIDKSFSFKDAREAYRHLKSGTHVGKVCIRFDV